MITAAATATIGRHSMPPKTPSVLCVGEALWDSLPSGGAPANVAMHLAALFRESGHDDD